jgi:hypothetical protein
MRGSLQYLEDLVNSINNRIIDYRDLQDSDTHGSNPNDKKELEMDKIYSNFKLYEKIVTFYDGREWNVISLDFMLKHPIMYYKHWSDKNGVYYDNSLLVCPITLRSMIYKGKIVVNSIESDGHELILENMDTGDTFPISNPYTGHFGADGETRVIKSHVKRHEVKILEHRDIFAFDSDPRYIVIADKSSDKDTVVNLEYYTDRLDVGNNEKELVTTLHPKSLVYVVQYYSKTLSAYRHIILISPAINKEKVSGYEYRSARIWKYMEENKDKLIEKRAFTYPILWCAIDKIRMTNYETTILG